MNPVFQYDPDLGFRFIPHLKTRIATPDGGYLLRTNALGFRNDREFEPKADGVRRVLVFGDSFTAGDNVSNGQRYSDVLDKALAPVEVHNFGLPGSGTDQQFIAYRKFAEGADCDVVVIAVLVENIRRIVAAYRPSEGSDGQVELVAKPYFELEGDALVRRHDPVPPERLTPEALEEAGKVDQGGRFPELRKLVRKLGLQSVVQQLTRYQPTPEYDSPDDPAWRLMRAILLAWRARIGQPVVLMPIPLYQHIEGTADPAAWRARFGEVAAEGGFILHDPLDDLWSYDAQTRRGFRFKTDVHLTPAGHTAIAQSLLRTLKPLLPPPASNAETAL